MKNSLKKISFWKYLLVNCYILLKKKKRKQVDIHYRIVLNIKTQRGPSVTVKSTYSLFSLFSLNSFTGQPLCSADSIQSPIFITHCFSGIPRLPPFNLRLFSLHIMFQIFKVRFSIHTNYYIINNNTTTTF